MADREHGTRLGSFREAPPKITLNRRKIIAHTKRWERNYGIEFAKPTTSNRTWLADRIAINHIELARHEQIYESWDRSPHGSLDQRIAALLGSSHCALCRGIPRQINGLLWLHIRKRNHQLGELGRQCKAACPAIQPLKDIQRPALFQHARLTKAKERFNRAAQMIEEIVGGHNQGVDIGCSECFANYSIELRQLRHRMGTALSVVRILLLKLKFLWQSAVVGEFLPYDHLKG